MKIIIDIKNCSQCPNFKSSPYPTADSFERAEYWWCTAANDVAPNEEAEIHRQSIIKYDKVKSIKYIAGYVEWHDKTPIPDWCPIKIVK